MGFILKTSSGQGCNLSRVKLGFKQKHCPPPPQLFFFLNISGQFIAEEAKARKEVGPGENPKTKYLVHSRVWYNIIPRNR